MSLPPVPAMDEYSATVEYRKHPFGADLTVELRALWLRDEHREHRYYLLAWARLTWQLQEWGFDVPTLLADLPDPEILAREETAE